MEYACWFDSNVSLLSSLILLFILSLFFIDVGIPTPTSKFIYYFERVYKPMFTEKELYTLFRKACYVGRLPNDMIADTYQDFWIELLTQTTNGDMAITRESVLFLANRVVKKAIYSERKYAEMQREVEHAYKQTIRADGLNKSNTHK